ncbi:Conserved_hypothetical protein [Hexamita inflata]|uniref:t-SNARE coiled-coil homology domain-containing protein n=1 Tax=Hexamita inflata TaxID=28002 RepID=A0AA86QM41_9EUKA|nr:Conserved hypothetical protein [Hexamita inflata]
MSVQSLYAEQARDISELRKKNTQLKRAAQLFGETLDVQNEFLGEVQTDFDNANDKMKAMKTKSKEAIKKLGKRGTILSTIGTACLIGILWLVFV